MNTNTMTTTYEKIDGKRTGSILYVQNGYTYTFFKEYKRHYRVRCSQWKKEHCKGTATISKESDCFTVTAKHCHKPDRRRIDSIKVNNLMKWKAPETTSYLSEHFNSCQRVDNNIATSRSFHPGENTLYERQMRAPHLLSSNGINCNDFDYQSLSLHNEVIGSNVELVFCGGESGIIKQEERTKEVVTMDETFNKSIMAPKKKYGIAICGMGRAGEIHLGNCQKNFKINVKYLVDLDVEKAEKLREEYMLEDATVLHADQFHTVLGDPNIDGVIICTVTNTHEEYVNKCIQAKKAVFCEKPIANNLKDILSCYESAEKENVPIFCAFNRRFDSTHASVKAAADSGEVGQIHMVKVCSRDSPLPSEAYLKISGGIFHDCAVHDIDMSMWILKECPISVFSHAHAFHQFIADMDDVDSVAISMKFASGAIAQIDLSRHAAYGYDQRLEVFGELGMLESENRNKTTVRKSTSNAISKDLIDYSFNTRYSGAYTAEINHFIDIMGGADSMVSKSDVLLVSLIASACEESHRTGKQMKINKERLTFEPL